MFKDTREELQRLEEALLQEAAAEQEEKEQDALLDDPADFGEDTPEIYQNYHNRHIRAYNTDVSDEDLDAYSEEVYQPRKRKELLVLSAIALCLIAGILAVLAYWAVRLWGRF